MVAGKAGATGQKAASITIALDLQPNRAVNVPFVTNSRKLGIFVLDDNVNSALADARVFDGLKAGSYVVRTGALPGLTLSQLGGPGRQRGHHPAGIERACHLHVHRLGAAVGGRGCCDAYPARLGRNTGLV
jgi:hypothetical protein